MLIVSRAPAQPPLINGHQTWKMRCSTCMRRSKLTARAYGRNDVFCSGRIARYIRTTKSFDACWNGRGRGACFALIVNKFMISIAVVVALLVRAARRHVQHKARAATLGSWGVVAHMPECAEWMQNGKHSHYSYGFSAYLCWVLLSLVSAHSAKMWRKQYRTFPLLLAGIWRRASHFNRSARSILHAFPFTFFKFITQFRICAQHVIVTASKTALSTRTKKAVLESGL